MDSVVKTDPDHRDISTTMVLLNNMPVENSLNTGSTTMTTSIELSSTTTTANNTIVNINTGPMVSFSLPHAVIIHSPTSANNQDDVISDEEARRRRELLARRPSYRKILNDLSGVELDLRHKDSGDSGGDSSEDSNTSESTMTGSQAGMPSSTLSGPSTDAISYAASIIPHVPLHLTGVNGDLNVGGLLPHGTASSLLHYPIQDGGHQQILMSGNDLLGLKPNLVSQSLIGFSSPSGILPSSKTSGLSQGHHSSSSGSSGGGTGEGGGGGGGGDTTRKREMRLLKNREAAKECRRKKKEYVKCLENRVTVLEAQNKQLIEELRALKELYCRKAD